MANNGKQHEINSSVWDACDTFRGTVDPAEYKNYVLTMLFIKYISDLHKDKKAEYEKKYNGNEERVNRALEKERFVLPDECDFDYLYQHREDENIGELIDHALMEIENHNKAKLENVFRNVSFNSEAALGKTVQRNNRLKNLLSDFANPKLDLRPSVIGNRDVIGDVYEYLIAKFAAGAGKKAGEFYTPPEVSELLAELVAPEEGDRICDPACGSGSLLIKVANQIGSKNYFIAGQESNGSTWSLCKMNMFLHGMDSARIEWCDTILNPELKEGDTLMKFDVVVANPPFSLKKWGHDYAQNDKYKRFWRGVPPKSRGDYAFISHMIEIALNDKGRVGVVVPHGVLFRGGSEGIIRKELIKDNLLEAVIGLPSKLFYGTGIPAAIMIFNKGRKPWSEAKSKREKHILFIEASREYEDLKKQSKLRDEDLAKIVKTFKTFNEIDKYSYLATYDEIKDADYNLNIPRYVDTFEEEEEIDIAETQKEIEKLEADLEETKKQMKKYLKELGL